MSRHYSGVCHAFATERAAPRPANRAARFRTPDRGVASRACARRATPRSVPPMMHDEDPVDLEPLGDFLDSTRAPEACMDLSELDGFLAGLAVGPAPVPPDEWLPM